MWLNIFSYYFRSILVKICEVIPVNQQRHQRRLQTKKLLYRRKKTIFNFYTYINYIKIREINFRENFIKKTFMDTLLKTFYLLEIIVTMRKM